MAILFTLPGVKAEILINGEPVTEIADPEEFQSEHEDPYVAEYQTTHTVCKYIQSETDQLFSLRFTVGAPYVKGTVMDHIRLGFHIFIDGPHVGDAWCSRLYFKHRPVGTKWVHKVEGVTSTTGGLINPFKFASIETNSDAMAIAEVKLLAQKLKKVGVIEIRVHSETAGRVGGPVRYSVNDLMLESTQDVPENALKGDAKSHGTALGEAKPNYGAVKSLVNKATSEDYPDVIFRFLYRDEVSLKQLHIIDRTPPPSSSGSSSSSRSPSPSPEPESSVPVKREADTSNTEDLIAMATRLLAQAKEQAESACSASRSKISENTRGKSKESERKKAIRIKRERVDDEQSRDRAAKKARKCTKLKPVVVDLTGDSNSDEDEGMGD